MKYVLWLCFLFVPCLLWAQAEQPHATSVTLPADSLQALSLVIPSAVMQANEGETLRILLDANGGKEPYQFSLRSGMPSDAKLVDNLFMWPLDYGLAHKNNKIKDFWLDFSVRDALGQEANGSIKLQVKHQNQAPRLNPTSLYVTVQPSVLTRHKIEALDEDGDPLTFLQVSSLPTGAQLSGQGVVSWTATPTQYDRLPIQILFKVSDGEVESTHTLTFSKYDAGLPPSLTQLSGKREIREGDKYELMVRVYDPDGLDDLSPMGLSGDVPTGYQLNRNENIYTLTWLPDYNYISSDATVKKQTLRFLLYVVDRNGSRAELPVELDVLDAPDHINLYRQYRGMMEDAAREIERIQQLQQFLATKAAKAERSKNRRAVLTAVVSASVAIIGAAAKDPFRVWGTAVGGGITALVSSLERTTIFPNPTQFSSDSDKLIESLIDLRVRATTFAFRYNNRDKRAKNEFNTEFGDLVRAMQTTRDKVDTIAKKYDQLRGASGDGLRDDTIRQLIPGFTPDAAISQ